MKHDVAVWRETGKILASMMIPLELDTLSWTKRYAHTAELRPRENWPWGASDEMRWDEINRRVWV